MTNLSRQNGVDFLKVAGQAEIRIEATALSQRSHDKVAGLQALGRNVQTLRFLAMTASTNRETCDQEAVFQFLMGLTADSAVRRIDTHAASVFLAGSRALKVKRAVHFPFLDYSTLAKRKAACEAELTVNRRFAPQIYRRVVSINRAKHGALNIDGDGPVVEYAVEMARFDERQTIDHIAETHPLEPELVSDIADTIAAAHAEAAPAPAEPWIESISSLVAGNTAALRAIASLPRQDVDELDTASRLAFARLHTLLLRRGQDGYVRHCHGDLHLGNIVLIERKPVLFDAIEFDPVMASTDVLYDLAFPIMDFLHHQRRAAANVLLNRYLTVTPAANLDALASLPLFMSIRAAVRAKVFYDRLAQTGGDVRLAEAAHAYFELARQSIAPAAPRLIAVGGLSGTGKSILAIALAPDVGPLPGAVLLRSDVIRKRQFRTAPTDRLPPNAYQAQVSGQVYEELAYRAGDLLSQGHSVIVDAVFARQSERTTIGDVARARNVPFTGLFLVADLATRTNRVSQRRHDASDATPEVAKRQEGYDVRAVDWMRIDAAGTPEQTLANGKAALDPSRPGPR